MVFGFIIVRHVNSANTNEYWQDCYRWIRKFYDEKIIIIDDNSNKDYLTNDLGMINCEIINSEYPARGEILGYYYLYKLKLFDKAVVIHDSCFIKQRVNFDIDGDVKFLWCFMHSWDEDIPTLRIISKLNNNQSLIEMYLSKKKWLGCFGVMSVITWDLLHKIDTNHDFFNMILEHVKCRVDRQYLERIFAVVCYVNSDLSADVSCSLFGDVHYNQDFSLTYELYKSVINSPDMSSTVEGISDYQLQVIINSPVVKVFTGR